MKKWLYGIVCVAFIGFLTACGGGDDDQAGKDNTPAEQEETNEDKQDTATADGGEALYQQSCSQCHGGDLVSGGAPDLNKIGSKYKPEEIQDIIANGKGNMPGGILKGEDAEAVASWLSGKK